jgi:hypothetical protein
MSGRRWLGVILACRSEKNIVTSAGMELHLSSRIFENRGRRGENDGGAESFRLGK